MVLHLVTMFYCGKAVRRNVLAIFLCYSVLTDLADSGALVECEPQMKRTENLVDAPIVFPSNSSEAKGKEIYPNPTHSCVGTLLKTVSQFVVTQNVEKNKSSKIFSRIRTTYSQIVKNMTDNLFAILFDIENAYNYSNFEQCLSMIDISATESDINSAPTSERSTKCAPTSESVTRPAPTTQSTTKSAPTTEAKIKSTPATEPEAKSAPATESESKSSFLVPVLLVIIMVLIAYVAVLHQKLRMISRPTAQFKNGKISRITGYHRQF